MRILLVFRGDAATPFLPQFSDEIQMHIFHKNIFAAVFALGMVSIPGVSQAHVVCNPVGSTNCFDFQCLPQDKTTLQPVPEVDTCLKPLLLAKEAKTRNDAVKLLAEGCTQSGGTIRDAGSKVSCNIAAKPRSVIAASARAKANCEGKGGVWDGGDIKGGGCTGPKK